MHTPSSIHQCIHTHWSQIPLDQTANQQFFSGTLSYIPPQESELYPSHQLVVCFPEENNNKDKSKDPEFLVSFPDPTSCVHKEKVLVTFECMSPDHWRWVCE